MLRTSVMGWRRWSICHTSRFTGNRKAISCAGRHIVSCVTNKKAGVFDAVTERPRVDAFAPCSVDEAWRQISQEARLSAFPAACFPGRRSVGHRPAPAPKRFSPVAPLCTIGILVTTAVQILDLDFTKADVYLTSLAY